ncbi:hypothetical protein D3C84_817740 [compost metagenome]
MDQVAVDIVHLQPSATGLERRLNPLGAMVGVPQLGGDEQVFAADCSARHHLLQGNADLFFISIALCTIEMTKARVQGLLDRLRGDRKISKQRAEPNRRHFTRAMVERKTVIAKCIVKGFVRHLFTPIVGAAAAIDTQGSVLRVWPPVARMRQRNYRRAPRTGAPCRGIAPS